MPNYRGGVGSWWWRTTASHRWVFPAMSSCACTDWNSALDGLGPRDAAGLREADRNSKYDNTIDSAKIVLHLPLGPSEGVIITLCGDPPECFWIFISVSTNWANSRPGG